MNTNPERVPVIIGVGQVNDRASTQDSLELMIAALEMADIDAGGGWIKTLDSLAVVNQISFPQLGNCAQQLATQFEISPGHVEQTPHPTGESPVQLLNEAANRIGTGECTVAAIVGAEALRTAAERARAATGSRTDVLRRVASTGTPSLLHQHGLVAPTDIYPLYENATRAAWGQSLAEAQSESGDLWEGMSKIAAKNPNAWIQKEITSDDVTRVESENRSIAFPYQKRMVANSSVNQGAGFIVTSLARAKAAGLSDDRIIHIGMGAAAHTTHNILKRDQYSHSTAMAVTLQETLKRNGIAATDLRHVELYSCFPCIPKMARRVINWPVDRPITAFGGLTFGGGPIGNYMSHAVASMVELLRQQGGNALLFANGGYATHNHAILISADPLKDAVFPHDFDCNAISEAKTGPAPAINEHYLGPAKIETYTVFFNRDGSVKMGTIIARTPENARVLASVPAKDSAMVAFLTDGKVEPVGTCGVVVAHEDGLSQWTSA